MALVFRDHLFRGARRVDQPATDSPDRFAYGFTIEIEEMLDKHIRMNGSNAAGAQHSLWKIAQVECYDFLSTAMDGSREHMAIVGIG